MAVTAIGQAVQAFTNHAIDLHIVSGTLTVTPEPATAGLLALGGLAGCLFRFPAHKIHSITEHHLTLFQ